MLVVARCRKYLFQRSHCEAFPWECSNILSVKCSWLCNWPAGTSCARELVFMLLQEAACSYYAHSFQGRPVFVLVVLRSTAGAGKSGMSCRILYSLRPVDIVFVRCKS
jgi:hypothetical protein